MRQTAVPSAMTEGNERSISPVMTTKVSASAMMPNCGRGLREGPIDVTLVNTAGADHESGHIASPTPMMPSWLPCRRKRRGPQLSHGVVEGDGGRIALDMAQSIDPERAGLGEEAVDQFVHADLALA